LVFNTVATGILISLFFFVTQETPFFIIILLMVCNGAFNAVQFTSMNTISLADLDTTTSSDGNSLLSVTQQLAISLGISISAMFLQLFTNSSIDTLDQPTAVFNYTFLVMGVLTILSSVVFMKLNKQDGANLAGQQPENKSED